MSDKPYSLTSDSRKAGELHPSTDQRQVDDQMKGLVQRLGELVGRAIAEKQSRQKQGVNIGTIQP